MIKNLVGITFWILQTTIPENFKWICPLEAEQDKKVCKEEQEEQEQEQDFEWIWYSAGAEWKLKEKPSLDSDILMIKSGQIDFLKYIYITSHKVIVLICYFKKINLKKMTNDHGSKSLLKPISKTLWSTIVKCDDPS